MRTEDILHETNNDITIQSLIDLITSDLWYKLSNSDNFKHGTNIEDLLLFSKVKQDLTVTNHGLVLKGARLVIPEKLHDRAIKLAHEGHQGSIKTKALIREKKWFPGIDRCVKIKIKQCFPSQSVTAEHKFTPLEMTDLPEKPWDNVPIDFSGPYPTGEYLLVMMDDYSRFPKVESLRSTSEKSVLRKLGCIFSTFGIPKVVKTDNGPPFNGIKFTEYAKQQGFHHRKTTPNWP